MTLPTGVWPQGISTVIPWRCKTYFGGGQIIERKKKKKREREGGREGEGEREKEKES